MTVQWSIIAESLAMSGHTKGRHGYGAIWGGMNATFHHNLIADHTSRNPRIGGGTPEADDNEHIGLCDIRNNVIYNWGFNTCYGGGRCNTNFVYNYAKAGKGTREEVKERLIDCGEKNKPGGFYVNGNVLEGNDGISSDNSKGIYISEANAPFTTISDKEFEMESIKNIKTDEPKEAYEKVLKMAGAVYPKRDAADARIIAQVKNDTGSFANVDNQLGGLPYREEIKRSDDFDKDKDGIEDEWEIKNGLDPTDSDDSRKMSKDGSGYTNIENYINSLVEMEHEAENSAIKITEPANNAIYAVGSAVNIKAECDDDVKKVIFCNGEEVIGEDDEKPFEMKLTGLKDGTYYISAKAVNERGEETASDASAVHINTYALSGWLQTDIGKPNISGNASYENGVYTVKGSGKVQGKSDAFCFMYNTMSGDGEISAKIESITAVDNHALSGLMIRESLAEDAAEVGIGLSHTKPYEWKEKDDETGKETTYYRNAFGVYMFSRDKKGENVDELAENLDSLEAAEKSGVALEKDIPFKEYDKFLGYYVKLKREGDTFTSYTSRDGVQWQQLSVKTVEMGKTVCIGIAVDGNKVNNELDNLNTAKFSEVKFINY
ncbi:MAG: hypothetical protein IJ583_01270, partial [Firmicutes bacterium]|nr:hypothetical protein [Bacillota bacterium]